MSEQSPRDTHFAGFAKAVRREEQNKMCGIGLDDWTPTKSEKVGRDVVARRAYDLVMHVLTILDRPEYIDDIPDLAELPEESEE